MSDESISIPSKAIDEIDKIFSKYQKILPPHVFDAVLSYVKERYMNG